MLGIIMSKKLTMFINHSLRGLGVYGELDARYIDDNMCSRTELLERTFAYYQYFSSRVLVLVVG